MASVAGLPPIPAVLQQTPVAAKQLPSAPTTQNQSSSQQIPSLPSVKDMQEKMMILAGQLQSNDNKGIVATFGNNIAKQISSLLNTGSFHNPTNVDGKWGDKTTTALNNIKDIAKYILGVSHQYNQQLKYFTDTQYRQLETLINDTKMSKDERAKGISQILDTLINSMKDEFTQVSSTFNRLTINQDENKFLSNSLGSQIERLPGSNLTWADLTSQENFNAYIQRNGIQEAEVPQLFDKLKRMINLPSNPY